jgi:hypothetical protein
VNELAAKPAQPSLIGKNETRFFGLSRLDQSFPKSLGNKTTPTRNGDSTVTLGIQKKLPKVLGYTREVGPELILYLPFYHLASNKGILKHKTMLTYAGMSSCFYKHLNFENYTDKNTICSYLPPQKRPE